MIVQLARGVEELRGDDDARLAWSAGVRLALPYTPHTLSLHLSTARTTTLQVTRPQAELIKREELAGVGLQESSRRVYPESTLGAQMLGGRD